jgi:hypothetical protein
MSIVTRYKIVQLHRVRSHTMTAKTHRSYGQDVEVMSLTNETNLTTTYEVCYTNEHHVRLFNKDLFI